MKVYIAAPWTCRNIAKTVAMRLIRDGQQISHMWWEYEADDDNHAVMADHAMNDLLAVLQCDLFLLLNLEKSEGKAVETGLALARRRLASDSRNPKPRMVGIGKRYSNIFQNLSDWEWYETYDDFARGL